MGDKLTNEQIRDINRAADADCSRLFAECKEALEALGFVDVRLWRVEKSDSKYARNARVKMTRGGIERTLEFAAVRASRSCGMYRSEPAPLITVSVNGISPSRTLTPRFEWKDGKPIGKPIKGESLAKPLAKLFDTTLAQEEADRRAKSREQEGNRIAANLNRIAGRPVAHVPWSFSRGECVQVKLVRLDEEQMVRLVTVLRENNLLDLLSKGDEDED